MKEALYVGKKDSKLKIWGQNMANLKESKNRGKKKKTRKRSNSFELIGEGEKKLRFLRAEKKFQYYF